MVPVNLNQMYRLTLFVMEPHRFIAVMATREMLRGSDIDRDLDQLETMMSNSRKPAGTSNSMLTPAFPVGTRLAPKGVF